MKIDENEKINIWLAGNTGLRNPMRIQEARNSSADHISRKMNAHIQSGKSNQSSEYHKKNSIDFKSGVTIDIEA